MSALDQKRISGRLFDHIIGEIAETIELLAQAVLRLNYELKLRWLLNWQLPALMQLRRAGGRLVKISFLFQSGGGGRTRTYEGIASGFTVRPLCRSGHSPEAVAPY